MHRVHEEAMTAFLNQLSYMIEIPHIPDENSDATSNKEKPMSEIAGAMVSGPMNLRRNPTSPKPPITT